MELKPGYKQTEVGVIPEDWNVYPLSDHFNIFAGGDVPKHSFSEYRSAKHPYPIFSNSLREAGLYGFTGEKRAKSDSLTITGRGHLGHAEYRCEEFFPIVRLVTLEPSGELDARFTALSINQTVEFAIESTGVPQLTAPQVGKFLVAAPPVDEQRDIAKVVADVDALLASLEGAIQKKKAIKQATMQELLTGKRRLPGFEGEWEEFSLGSVASMNSGGTPPTGRDDYYGGGIPWVSISDMTSGGKFISQTERTLSAAGLANCSAKQFPAGTILYAMYASLGECSIATTEVTTSQAILGIRPGESLHNEFLYYYLSSSRDKVKLMGQQGTQSNLNKGIVQGFTLRLPDKAEQIAIAEALGEIDQEL
ncbi:MAG: restriction endonuclease subunit S, partial [Cyanobacteriota bacterium]